jgi:RNA polymerase sigma-70 factor (ECF subfamily)
VNDERRQSREVREEPDERGEREERWRGWMVDAQGGDAAAYEKLLFELLPHLRSFVRHRLHDPNVQEDVVQNVFVSIHRARHTFRSERPIGPWLYAISRNAVTDHLRAQGRRRRREIPVAPEEVSQFPAIEESSIDETLSLGMTRALDALSANQREAVLMIHVEGLSVAEAAHRAGVSRGALKVRAHRGYRALRALLPKGEGE